MKTIKIIIMLISFCLSIYFAYQAGINGLWTFIFLVISVSFDNDLTRKLK